MAATPAALFRALAAVALCLGAGCASVPIPTARGLYYQGEPARAAALLEEEHPRSQDQVLFLMERGMMKQAAGDLEGSSADFIAAQQAQDRLETLSLSKGTSSMVINDTMNDYLGKPFERVLLHNLTALNHLALGRADDAGVEARRAFQYMDAGMGTNYPQVAFGWYITALSLQLADDGANAEVAYRRARDINEASPPPLYAPELVYVVLAGRAPADPYQVSQTDFPPTAMISVNGTPAGESVLLSDTHNLSFSTMQAEALAKAAKTATRIVMKEGIAQGVGHATDNEALEELIRLLLIFILERPDTRHWGTLPQWLMVARVPLTGHIASASVTINGRNVDPIVPPVQFGNTWFCFSRIY